MNTEKTTDSEILAKLLYMAFVAPQRPSIQIGDVSFNPFCDALELYARTRMRELNEDGPAAASEPDTPPEPAADTHTHTAGINSGEGRAPGAFVGYAAGEKRDIFERITAYVKKNGPGARRRIANETNGALTHEELLTMSEGKPMPLAKWRIAAAALDRLEDNDSTGE